VTTDRAYIPELDSDVVMRPGEAYMYDGYTRPDARSAGLDGAIRCFIFRSMREAGRHRLYSYVRGDNPVGLRAARRWQTSAGTVSFASVRGLSPRVRSGRGRLPQLVKRTRETRERTQRAQALHSWFRGWTVLPLENRSTGYTAPPEAYFASTARYVVDSLALDAREDFVLDVGCDSAMVSRLVAPHCRRFVGVDFIPEMLAEIGRAGLMVPGAGAAAFAAADGRQLPFASATFTKVYCTGVVHALPSRQDGLAMIRELVRVCAPGGRVLVGAIPDSRKRWRRRRDLWKQGGLKPRVKIILSLVTPAWAKRIVRRLAGSAWPSGPSFLDYDLEDLARTVEGDGIHVEVASFPDGFWSEDFRRTRSNLLVTKLPQVPLRSQPLRREPSTGRSADAARRDRPRTGRSRRRSA
jgi:SAM-dependent methyltransferase